MPNAIKTPLSVFFCIFVTLTLAEEKRKQSVFHARVKVSEMKGVPQWDPTGDKPCPVKVEEAARLAVSAFQEDFPEISLKSLFVSCKLSAMEGMAAIEHDEERGREFALNPLFWQIEFTRKADDPFVKEIDVSYLVLLDKTVVRPKK